MKFLRQIFALAVVFVFSNICFSQNKIENNKEEKHSKKSDNLISVKTNVLILDAKNQKEVVEAAQAVLSELRSQYFIEYVSTNQKSGDKNRKLRVEVAAGAKGE